jgi:hypothetical protein
MDAEFANAKAALERVASPVPDALVHSLLAASARFNRPVEDILLAVNIKLDAKRRARAFAALRQLASIQGVANG